MVRGRNAGSSELQRRPMARTLATCIAGAQAVASSRDDRHWAEAAELGAR
jgi:hypothetical protein